MTAHKKENVWKVIEVKMNWKCYNDRGHSTWGTGNCL